VREWLRLTPHFRLFVFAHHLDIKFFISCI
jgi:hypothetical protein